MFGRRRIGGNGWQIRGIQQEKVVDGIGNLLNQFIILCELFFGDFQNYLGIDFQRNDFVFVYGEKRQ